MKIERRTPPGKVRKGFHSIAQSSPLRTVAAGQVYKQKNIRVLVVDDHPVVRRGLASCFAPYTQIVIAGEASNGREAIEKAKALGPDIILMDLDMPQINGLSATETLCKENPHLKVLILTMHRNPEYVLRILQSGARGYVVKEAPTEELLRAIETVHAGGTYFSSEVAQVALNRFVQGVDEGNQPGRLSNRECEVLIAIAEGQSNKEIALRLSIGVRTVETHRERIMQKLSIHSVAGLTKYAVRAGLVVVPQDLQKPSHSTTDTTSSGMGPQPD